MTRKDYIAVSNIISAEKSVNRDNPDVLLTLINVTHSLADVMASDNPNFDRERFYAACK